ncbi:MAG: beta-ketoacyl-ACP synthase II [Candidatus Limnocylindrales bacterium]
MTYDEAARRRRVVITGLGAVTPLGADVARTWSRLVAGESGIRTIQSFDPSRLDSRMAGEVPDFDASHVFDRKELRRNDRYTQFALVAAREAMADAGLPDRFEGEEALSTGILIGSGLGGTASLMDQVSIWVERGPDRLSPFFIPMTIANMASGQVSISTGAMGPNFAAVSACASAGHAIGEASEIILRGDAEMMLAGGSEATVHEAVMGGFAAMRALSTRNDDPAGASRPFDRGRDGFICAEGAGVVVLEELAHAQARGATILAELCGYAATADANHITSPAPGGAGALRAARRALVKAGIDASEIDVVNAHATSTPDGDGAELQAIRALLGDRAAQVSITATKGAIGHTLGAAGGITTVVAVREILDGCVPPTLNLVDPDPEVRELDCTPLTARRRDVRVALVNAFGFGGQNSCLVLRRWDD